MLRPRKFILAQRATVALCSSLQRHRVRVQLVGRFRRASAYRVSGNRAAWAVRMPTFSLRFIKIERRVDGAGVLTADTDGSFLSNRISKITHAPFKHSREMGNLDSRNYRRGRFRRS